jgi:hypothetical protein
VSIFDTYIGTKAEVPDDETKIIKAAYTPVMNVGLPTATKPMSVVPAGARVGVSWTPTAMVRIPTAMKSVAHPIQASNQSKVQSCR